MKKIRQLTTVMACLLTVAAQDNLFARDNKGEQYDRFRNDGYEVRELKHFNHLEMVKATAAIASGGAGPYFRYLATEVVKEFGKALLKEALAHPDRVFRKNGHELLFKVITVRHHHEEKFPRVKWRGTKTKIEFKTVTVHEPNSAALILLIK